MPMHHLIEYRGNYSKTSGSLWQYCRDDSNDPITHSESFKYKIKITGKILVDGNATDVKIAVPFNYFSRFWRTREMSLISCRLN